MTFYPNPKLENERTGLIVIGQCYPNLVLKSGKYGISLMYGVCEKNHEGKSEKERTINPIGRSTPVYLYVLVT